MPIEILRQANFTGGELDPACLGRRDLKAYLASCSSLANCVVQPQGPVNRRPGLAFVSRVRNPVLALDPPAMTAPHGGAAANARVEGGDPFVSGDALGAADGFVVLECDFGGAVSVGLVDVADCAVAAA